MTRECAHKAAIGSLLRSVASCTRSSISPQTPGGGAPDLRVHAPSAVYVFCRPARLEVLRKIPPRACMRSCNAMHMVAISQSQSLRVLLLKACRGRCKRSEQRRAPSKRCSARDFALLPVCWQGYLTICGIARAQPNSALRCSTTSTRCPALRERGSSGLVVHQCMLRGRYPPRPWCHSCSSSQSRVQAERFCVQVHF